MTSLLSFPLLALGALLAAAMGFSIQRGATCTVAAVDELITTRKVNRLRSILEASLWVLGGLLAAQALHMLGKMPPGYAVTRFTIAGAVLLGTGAYINRACVFGAIARFGCGEWAYLATPLGFYLGCRVFRASFTMPPNPPLPDSSILFRYPITLGGMVLIWLVYRVLSWSTSAHLARQTGLSASAYARHVWHILRRNTWSPGLATSVIGISFVCMFLLLGPWAYTDVLSDLSLHMSGNLLYRGVLLIALFLGAVIGGWAAGRLQAGKFEPGQWVRCLLGGAMMGGGSLMIPGSNDGLLLVGLPLLLGYAWVALAVMGISIALCILASRAGQR